MINKQDLDADWHDMLTHQIAELKSSEYYWKQLPDIFKWLYKLGLTKNCKSATCCRQ